MLGVKVIKIYSEGSALHCVNISLKSCWNFLKLSTSIALIVGTADTSLIVVNSVVVVVVVVVIVVIVVVVVVVVISLGSAWAT